MSALPQPPSRLLTIADFAALPEDEQHRWELLEGSRYETAEPFAIRIDLTSLA
jgi:hypothetical protein